MWWRQLDRKAATPIERQAHDVMEHARAALVAAPDDDVDAAVEAVSPVLGMYWPDRGGDRAVEALRHAAMRLPQMRSEAREIRRRDRPIPWQEPAPAVG